VTPALASLLLGNARKLHHEKDGALVRWLKRMDTRLLGATLRNPGVVIVGAFSLVVASAAVVPLLGREFLPPFNEGTITVTLQAPPGTSLDASNQLGKVAEQLILGVPEVVSTGRRTGRAELDEHAEGVHYSELDVALRPSARSRDEVFADLRARLALLPGVRVNLGQPIGHRLDHLLSGVRAQLALKLFGPDLDVLRAKADELARITATVPGLVDVQAEPQVLVPQWVVRPLTEKAQLYGLTPGGLAREVEAALSGEVVTQLLDGQRVIDVVLRYPQMKEPDAASLERLLLDTPSGGKIPLGSVAQVLRTAGPNQINHEGGGRRVVVSANISGRDVGAAVEELRRVLAARLAVPPGYTLTYGGQFESQQAATSWISLLALLSLAGMIAVLYGHFRSWMITAQILLNIPLALVGAVIAVWWTGGVLSVATLVGFVTLTGIASRNGIMMISHYLHLMREEGEGFTREMITRGSLERLVPVLMTALTAVLALLPLAFSAGAPGKEILQPVAVVIVGGLLSSTLLDMVVTPAVFWRFGKSAAEGLTQRANDEELD
jgi:Cu/Ag efflux pump CusA